MTLSEETDEKEFIPVSSVSYYRRMDCTLIISYTIHQTHSCCYRDERKPH